MAVAFDAYSDSGLEASPNWTHTPSGTPRGVIVFVQGLSGSDVVGVVTYGGVTMTEVSGSPNLKAAAESMGEHCFFLGSSIPTGAQTVAVDTGGTSSVGHCITVTATVNTEVVDTDATINSNSIADPSGTLALAGRTCFCALGFISGQDSAANVTPFSGWTSRVEISGGSIVAGCNTYNTVGSADVAAGWTQTAEDAVAIGVAISEVGGGAAQNQLAWMKG